MSPPLFESDIRSLPLLARGKVRDIYEVDASHLLIVTTDRLSAFDVILPDPIPRKGAVLNQMSLFWFERFRDLVPNHLTAIRAEDVVSDTERWQVRGRAVVAKRLRPLPIEAVARGYLAGSGWKDYCASGAVSGVALPRGLAQSAKLPEPIFTPATKAEQGEHDENIDLQQVEGLLGSQRAARVRELTLTLYAAAQRHAEQCGIIVADTKFEFGLDESDQIVMIDEVLTADSSRFWPADQYREGGSPPSFDKQFVRDYLESIHWPKRPPAPRLPAEVIQRTSAKYQEALRRLTGRPLEVDGDAAA